MPKPSQRASSAPTSLLSHPMDGSSTNCLAQAVRFARDGIDEIVFLSAPGQAEAVGHVILRDARSGSVYSHSCASERKAIGSPATEPWVSFASGAAASITSFIGSATRL